MEFNARYAVTGFFAIMVVLGVFAFVYWLENAAGFGERSDYRIRFTVPVSGLANGSSVLFNGIAVGEVTSIAFDAARPDSIVATISIASITPVRSDTEVGIDYQGLTGAANILLTGGDPSAPEIAASNGSPPELDADPAASRSWMQNAGRVLGRLDQMLERNSDRFDGIMAGLEKLAGGTSDDKNSVIHDLPLPTEFGADLPEAQWQMAVAEPSVLLALNTDRILEQPAPASFRGIEGSRWADNLPNLLQAKLLQSFENAGYAGAVLRPGDLLDPDFRIAIDIRGFQIDTSGEPRAEIELTARLLDRDGKVIANREFAGEAPASGTTGSDAAAALGGVFSQLASQIVIWSVETASSSAE